MGSLGLKPQSIAPRQLLGQNGLNAVPLRAKISISRRKNKIRISAASVNLAGSVCLNHSLLHATAPAPFPSSLIIRQKRSWRLRLYSMNRILSDPSLFLYLLLFLFIFYRAMTPKLNSPPLIEFLSYQKPCPISNVSVAKPSSSNTVVQQ